MVLLYDSLDLKKDLSWFENFDILETEFQFVLKEIIYKLPLQLISGMHLSRSMTKPFLQKQPLTHF